MARKIESSSSDRVNNKSKAKVPRGKGTELPYGFGVEDLKKGLNALAYADGNTDGFHQALDLRRPTVYYVSKALRTIGLLNEGFEKTPIGQNFVNSPSRHDTILSELMLGYEPYKMIITACAVDPLLQSEADLRWVAQKLASEIKTSQKPKTMSRQAATSFGAFVSEAGLGSMTAGKSGKIKWKVPPSQILQKPSPPASPLSEPKIDKAELSSALAVPMNITQPHAQSIHHDPSPVPPTYQRRQAVFSQEEINGGFSIGSSYFSTTADMTSWTETQIRTYWDGRNRELEFLLELLRLKVQPQ